MWERPLAAIRRMPAAGFVQSCNRGQARSHKTGLRLRFERVLVGAAFGRDAAHAGRGLRSRLNRGRARSHQPRLRLRFERVLVGAASGRDTADACRRLCLRLHRGQARSHPTPAPFVVRAGLLWERPLAAMRRGHAAGFVQGCNHGQARSHKTGLRLQFERVLVGAASGRDAAHAGRGLRSRLNRGRARSHQTPARSRSGRALVGLTTGSVRALSELLWERPLAATRRMPAAGLVQG